MPTWPLKDEHEPDFKLVVEADGMVRLKPLRDACMTMGVEKKMSKLWSSIFSVTQGEVDRVHISDLLQASSKKDESRWLFKQLSWKLSSRIENLILQALRTGSKLGISAKTLDLLDIMWDNNRLDSEILKHCVAAKQQSAGFLNFTILTDEAHVGGPSLFNSVVVLKTNLAIPQLPQVRWGSGRGLGGQHPWPGLGGARTLVGIQILKQPPVFD